MKIHRHLNDKQDSGFNRRWVRETRYGRWFLNTQTWERYVIQTALKGFLNLIGNNIPCGGKVLDIACGPGAALPHLAATFEPSKLFAVDIDADVLSTATVNNAARCACPVELHHASAYSLPFENDSFDVIFCHQLLHHSADQAAVLEELRRVLAPNGLLLSGESCKVFIHWWWVRVFFRHPMEVQKTAAEYLQLLRDSQFKVTDSAVTMHSPWWSRRDIGISERLGIPQRKNAEPTEILMVAQK